MPWTIEIAQLPLAANIAGVSLPIGASHVFWRLKDDSGTIIRELHGLATDRFGNIKTIGGPLNPLDSLGMYDFAATEFSLSGGTGVTALLAWTGTEADALETWDQAAWFARTVTQLRVSYGPLTLGNYNSNSMAEMVGDLLGFPFVEPPLRADGSETWAPGWNQNVATDIINGLIRSIEARERLLGRELTTEEFQPYFSFLERIQVAEDFCFLPGTPVLRPDGSETSIEAIRAGDYVLSYAADGTLVPARVTATSRREVRHVLDLFGLMVTPGHVMLCADGPFAGRHVPLIDILRTDGALVRADGSQVRAATGAMVGSEADRKVWVVAGHRAPQGFIVTASAQLRRGTRLQMPQGQDFTLADLIAANGGRITDDGLIDRGTGAAPVPFVWPFGPLLPRPEDHVLARSGVTLADIHAAAEWEDVQSYLPAPPPGGLADLGPALPATPGLRAAVRPNLPQALRAEEAGAPRGPRAFMVQGGTN